MGESGPRVLVVQQDDLDPVGPAADWLDREGLGCEVLAAHRGAPVPADLDGHAGLVVLGGEAGATEDGAHPWLAPTRALVAATATAGQPFLGICLGHQLAAVALGGSVTRNPHGPSRGLLPWAPTGAGRTDPLTSALPAGTEVLHWNDDVAVRLPPGAVPLGTAPDGTVQAARFGPRAWGVQFHPEVSADVVAAWGHGSPTPAERDATARLRAREGELHRAWAPLLRRFAQVVRAG